MRSKIFVGIDTFEDVVRKSFNLDVVTNVDGHAFGFSFIEIETCAVRC